jgi:hypothetical protein
MKKELSKTPSNKTESPEIGFLKTISEAMAIYYRAVHRERCIRAAKERKDYENSKRSTNPRY